MKAQYFSHDVDARIDPDIIHMRAVYGFQGYGWFWALVEMMCSKEELALPYNNQYVWAEYAMQLQTDAKTLKKFVADCVNEFNLFVADDKWFWSESLLRRMEKVKGKSEAMRANAAKRWDEQQQSVKEKPKKEIPPGFDEFWKVYPRRVEKDRAMRAFRTKLKNKVDPQELIRAATEYANTCKKLGTEERFIKHPATFINAVDPFTKLSKPKMVIDDESDDSEEFANGFIFK